eukprot:15126122-Alexandrium_andersonii.AAC.1
MASPLAVEVLGPWMGAKRPRPPSSSLACAKGPADSLSAARPSAQTPKPATENARRLGSDMDASLKALGLSGAGRSSGEHAGSRSMRPEPMRTRMKSATVIGP